LLNGSRLSLSLANSDSIGGCGWTAGSNINTPSINGARVDLREVRGGCYLYLVCVCDSAPRRRELARPRDGDKDTTTHGDTGTARGRWPGPAVRGRVQLAFRPAGTRRSGSARKFGPML
jgi:hypothetical protein